MPHVDLSPLIAKAVAGHDLSAEEAEAGFEPVMQGRADPVQVGGLLVALQTKGVAPAELAGGVRALTRAMVPVRASRPDGLVDTAGTGGGEVTTFNISTAAAIVAAAGGVRLAKHGNRSFTSRSGSADVLETLGVRIELTPDAMAAVLEEVGIVFMFAPLLHPAMRHVAPVRRVLGVTTLMNFLGPLANPAGARRQVIGVARPDLLPLISGALLELGHDRAMVVHGNPGMDEISPSGVTEIVEIDSGQLHRYELSPDDVGLDEHGVGALAGGEPEENARIIRQIFDGGCHGAARNAVALNAAAALVVGGAVDALSTGVERATHVLDSGAAAEKLDALIEATNRLGN